MRLGIIHLDFNSGIVSVSRTGTLVSAQCTQTLVSAVLTQTRVSAQCTQTLISSILTRILSCNFVVSHYMRCMYTALSPPHPPSNVDLASFSCMPRSQSGKQSMCIDGPIPKDKIDKVLLMTMVVLVWHSNHCDSGGHSYI